MYQLVRTRVQVWLLPPKLYEKSQPMVDCLCNGPTIYDHYCRDTMKMSRQVITLNTTQALIP